MASAFRASALEARAELGIPLGKNSASLASYAEEAAGVAVEDRRSSRCFSAAWSKTIAGECFT